MYYWGRFRCIVDLKSPTSQAYNGDYTVVDLPSFTNHGYDSKIQYYRSLARHYILQQTIVAVVVHISGTSNLSISGFSLTYIYGFYDAESEHESSSLRYVRTIAEDTRITGTCYLLQTCSILTSNAAVILTYPELVGTSPAWLDDAQPPYRRFTFKIPEGAPDKVFQATDIELLRQDEAAYFLFLPIWSQPRHQLGMGVPKILQGWVAAWKQVNQKRERKGSKRYLWIFTVLFVLAM